MIKTSDSKPKIRLLLCSTTLAVALTATPFSMNLADFTLDSDAAFAKGSNSGSGSSNSGRGSDDDDNSGSGSSNSGSGSDDDDGDGDGDDDDDNSGSGSSNSGSGSDNDDDDDDNDDDDRGERTGRRGGNDDGRGGPNTPIPDKFGFIVKAEIQGNHIEIGYSDGWKEEVENGRYELKNPSNRTVIERPATQSDINRLNAAIRGSRL